MYFRFRIYSPLPYTSLNSMVNIFLDLILEAMTPKKINIFDLTLDLPQIQCYLIGNINGLEPGNGL